MFFLILFKLFITLIGHQFSEGKIKIVDFDTIALRDKLEDARRWVKYMKCIKE